MSIGVAASQTAAQVDSQVAPARDIIEDYENLEVIGKGSFGTVFKAIRKSDRQQVVVKEVLLSQLNEAERRCALQEASTLSKLQHDNIIRYHETRSTEGVVHISTVHCVFASCVCVSAGRGPATS
jgi:serine/threonine protein kinase